MSSSDSSTSARTGAAALHDLKNRAASLLRDEGAEAQSVWRTWAFDLRKFLDFALACCERGETEGVVVPGETSGLKRLLAPHCQLLLDLESAGTQPSRADVERLWCFLQADEASSGPLSRSVADELMDDQGLVMWHGPDHPVLRAVGKVLRVLLPAAEKGGGHIVLLAAEDGMEELAWAGSLGTSRIGVVVSTAALTPSLRKALLRTDFSCMT